MQCRTAAGRLWSLPRQRPHKLRPIPISQFPIIPLSLFCQCQKRPAGIRRALLVYRGINLSVSLCSTRPGCGSQHPQRFACVLLTAAPTTTPCFRHWRRSSLLPLVGEPLAKRAGFTKCQGLSSIGATTMTAASGGNRESLLGPRPARRKQSAADAGCRNPGSGTPSGVTERFSKKEYKGTRL